MQASNFSGAFDKFFLWISLWKCHRRCVSILSIPWCKKVKNDQKLNSSRSCLNWTRMYTHQRPVLGRLIDSAFQLLTQRQPHSPRTNLEKEDGKGLIHPKYIGLPFHCKNPASSADAPFAVHVWHTHEPDRGSRRSTTSTVDCWRLSKPNVDAWTFGKNRVDYTEERVW